MADEKVQLCKTETEMRGHIACNLEILQRSKPSCYPKRVEEKLSVPYSRYGAAINMFAR